MASSGHFDPSQTYDGQKAVELLVAPCTESLMKGKQCFQHFNPRSSNYHYCFVGNEQYKSPVVPLSNIKSSLFRKKDGPFGKEFPIFEAPTPDGTSGCSSCIGMLQGGPILEGPFPLVVGQFAPVQRLPYLK
ncbi:hypothetical protein O181_114944 [Austropuccinia psidii MF-1]|uniref:Uncharacterized protein n=1 Tax=Austropuccinia psidii MF-1 TaxID=1389203 RepID=A0A9Q3K8S7_9BASI|nr:hypothetical protein [Austropuccinia psidii MF-1]